MVTAWYNLCTHMKKKVSFEKIETRFFLQFFFSLNNWSEQFVLISGKFVAVVLFHAFDFTCES